MRDNIQILKGERINTLTLASILVIENGDLFQTVRSLLVVLLHQKDWSDRAVSWP